MSNLSIVIIGGGAAGFFAALSCKQHHPDADVVIVEKTSKLLAKVKVSGGGRCNVTNAESDIKVLATNYPRGDKQLRKLFGHFSTTDTIEWFENRDVPLEVYPDGCIFPESNDSQTIIDCFLNEARSLGVVIKTQHLLTGLRFEEGKYQIEFKEQDAITCDKIIVATGGHPKMASFDWLAKLGHEIAPPVPSLFTFNMPNEAIRDLMGVVVDPAFVRIQGTKLKATGPLLITHWGMSGPAILKLSAWGARILEEKQYEFSVLVSWATETNEDLLREQIDNSLDSLGKRMLKNANPFSIPTRLWIYLLDRGDINPELTWDQLGRKNGNRLVNILANDTYEVKGKTTFKEEFVTCGGVALSSINMTTMESKVAPGMYFAGEVMDMDGITGGFNFQAAWTTAFIAGKLT